MKNYSKKKPSEIVDHILLHITAWRSGCLRARQYQSENVQLNEKLKTAEVEIYHLSQTKQVNYRGVCRYHSDIFFAQTIYEEIQALKSQHDLLKIDHRQLKPTCLRLEQELQSLQRINKQLEDELVRVKNREAELYDLENDRFNR